MQNHQNRSYPQGVNVRSKFRPLLRTKKCESLVSQRGFLMMGIHCTQLQDKALKAVTFCLVAQISLPLLLYILDGLIAPR